MGAELLQQLARVTQGRRHTRTEHCDVAVFCNCPVMPQLVWSHLTPDLIKPPVLGSQRSSHPLLPLFKLSALTDQTVKITPISL